MSLLLLPTFESRARAILTVLILRPFLGSVVAGCAEQLGTVMPHSAFLGQTPDEIYFGIDLEPQCGLSTSEAPPQTDEVYGESRATKT